MYLLVTGLLVGVGMVQIWVVWTRTTAPDPEPRPHYSCFEPTKIT